MSDLVSKPFKPSNYHLYLHQQRLRIHAKSKRALKGPKRAGANNFRTWTKKAIIINFMINN